MRAEERSVEPPRPWWRRHRRASASQMDRERRKTDGPVWWYHSPREVRALRRLALHQDRTGESPRALVLRALGQLQLADRSALPAAARRAAQLARLDRRS